MSEESSKMEVDDPQPPSPDISSLKEAAKEIMEKSDGDNKSENGDNKVNGSQRKSP